jgi:hypothetical protein
VIEAEPAPPLEQQAELGMPVRVVFAVEDRRKAHRPPPVLRPRPAPRPQHAARVEFPQRHHQVLAKKTGE